MTADYQPDIASWTRKDALDLYMIDRWSSGYFDVNESGEITVAPLLEGGETISLFDVVKEALAQDLQTPLVIRFQDIVRHRVKTLNEAFQRAIKEFGYEKPYRGVYPVKVNQLREVVEEILHAEKSYGGGLEVGSKAEIYAALAVHSNEDALIICNGYKDRGYVQTALTGSKLAKTVVLVAEKLSEVELIVETSRDMGVPPFVGFRMRLSTEGTGNWATSGGVHAKFGLSTSEILKGIEILEEAHLENSLGLLHFHIGSQIPNILTIKSAVREAARFYAKLRKMGYQIEFLDVGGGLAVDYDGSRSNFHSSMNYSIEEYARDIVYNIADICREEGVPHPTIISESGRAIVAHHSVLVVSAFGSIRKTPDRVMEHLPDRDHKLVRDLLDIEQRIDSADILESWHDLIQINREAQKLFDVGLLELPPKAAIEILFWRIAQRIRRLAEATGDLEIPEELVEMDDQLADQHICNFSVFQSLLDHWALGQVFPVVPIHRLNEEPDVPSKLVDITCDSDGKVSKFINLADVSTTLLLHDFGDEPYYLGLFLVGAYQDIMGDIHNLFGRVNEAHVFLDDEEEQGFYIEEKIDGNTIGEVLAMTQYDSKDLIKRLKAQVNARIKADQLKPSEGMQLLELYRKGLAGQTYLEL